jgi:MATE family multidrug resistance protein
MSPITHKQLFALALPMILSNITVPLLGLVDTAVIGHLSEAYFLGATSVGATVITFITWLCGFLRMSTTGLTAQANGANQTSHVILIRGLAVACLIGFTFILLQQPYINLGLYLAGGSAEVQQFARQYSEIRIYGLPAALCNLVLLGWLLGHHKAKLVMWLLMLTNLCNILLDLLFVIGFDWQVKGVAIATLLSEYSGLVMGLWFAHKTQLIQMNHLTQYLHSLRESSGFLAFFKLNRDILIRTLCLELVFVFITFWGARLGDNIVASNAILLNFLLLISFGLDGIANAAEVLVGKAYGAKNTKAVHQAVILSAQWTLIFALGYSVIFLLFHQYLVQWITTIPDVIETTQHYMPWMIILPIVGCWCYLLDGIYIGLLQAKAMRNSMIIATFLGFFPLWFLFQSWGNHGLWLAFVLFLGLRGITLAWHYWFTLRPEFNDK